jgi:4-diphosphocytidyl-2-C-methyl-D-erythritol kinase
MSGNGLRAAAVPRALTDLPAPAKLNEFLHVVGRRANGYHLIQSLFVLIDWADVIHLERRADGQLHRHDLGPALPADDLCLRAARRLQQEADVAWGADIHLDKRVPWGAGLGGGSSDAATVLLGLNRLWGLHWPRDRLMALGLQLGADVPFFLGGAGAAFVEGIGETLRPIPLPVRRYAVVKPPEPVSTPSVFQDSQLRRDSDPAIVSDFVVRADFSAQSVESFLTSVSLRNDLQPVAERLCPSVAQAARWLEAQYGNSRMSGSGSAVYASMTVRDAPSLATAPSVGSPRDLPTDWVVRHCRSLNQHPLRDWAD